MKIAVAQIWQETNTFSPVLADFADFEAFRLHVGEEVMRNCGDGQEIGGFVAAAEAAEELELVPILAAGAWPGGRVAARVMAHLEETLLNGLAAALPVDAVLLSLHGSMVAETVDDVEGHLLSEIRTRVGPDVPIAVSLDHHANITKQMIDHCDILVGYRSLPHIDMFETGQRTADLLLSRLRGETTPTVARRKIPMITPADRFFTTMEPMKTWFDAARELEERPEVLSVSLFPVQPWLDVPELGWTTVVTTDGDGALAQSLADQLAEMAWERRELFFVQKVPPAEAIRQAVAIDGGPIVIADGSDSVNSGAPGDSTHLLKALLGQSIGGQAFVTVVDPEAVESALAAGIGSEVTLDVGGKRDRVFSQPVTVSGRVARTSNGRFTIGGHLGADIDMGRTVVLNAGEVQIVLSEQVGAGHDPMVYRHIGLEPAEAKIVVVKTPVGFRLAYSSIMKAAILADCPGLSPSDLRILDYEKAPRPLFPLDDLTEWRVPA